MFERDAIYPESAGIMTGSDDDEVAKE